MPTLAELLALKQKKQASSASLKLELFLLFAQPASRLSTLQHWQWLAKWLDCYTLNSGERALHEPLVRLIFAGRPCFSTLQAMEFWCLLDVLQSCFSLEEQRLLEKLMLDNQSRIA